MKLVAKILKILFGLALFLYGACSMAIAPNFTPRYFSMDILRVTELIMFYLVWHGISLIVWTIKNEEPNREFRIEVTDHSKR